MFQIFFVWGGRVPCPTLDNAHGFELVTRPLDCDSDELEDDDSDDLLETDDEDEEPLDDSDEDLDEDDEDLMEDPDDSDEAEYRSGH